MKSSNHFVVAQLASSNQNNRVETTIELSQNPIIDNFKKALESETISPTAAIINIIISVIFSAQDLIFEFSLLEYL